MGEGKVLKTLGLPRSTWAPQVATVEVEGNGSLAQDTPGVTWMSVYPSAAGGFFVCLFVCFMRTTGMLPVALEASNPSAPGSWTGQNGEQEAYQGTTCPGLELGPALEGSV